MIFLKKCQDDDGNIDEVDSASASKRDLSWCLPKEYAKERPDFVGEWRGEKKMTISLIFARKKV